MILETIRLLFCGHISLVWQPAIEVLYKLVSIFKKKKSLQRMFKRLNKCSRIQTIRCWKNNFDQRNIMLKNQTSRGNLN